MEGLRAKLMELLSLNEIAGLGLGLTLGAACRWFDLPLPAPPKLSGALLVVFMSSGFHVTGEFL